MSDKKNQTDHKITQCRTNVRITFMWDEFRVAQEVKQIALGGRMFDAYMNLCNSLRWASVDLTKSGLKKTILNAG